MSSFDNEKQRDQSRLERWFSDTIENAPVQLKLTRLNGGQSNPTWRCRTNGASYVLRAKPLGETLPSAHAIDREYRVINALKPTGVPVPEAVAYCDDTSVFGSEFYVMTNLEGRVLMDPQLVDFTSRERSQIFEAMNDAIATIHKVDIDAVGLGDFGRHEGYIQRQISRWTRQYRQSETTRNGAMENLIDWLTDHSPQDGLTRLVHGDFRLDNVMLHPTRPEIIGVLDWELSTLGSPVADFAYHVMVWRFAPELFRGLAGTDFAATGIPDEATYVDRYFKKTGLDRPVCWDFYIVLGMFRLSAIIQGILKRSMDGTASDANAAVLGAKAVPISELAWDIARNSRRKARSNVKSALGAFDV